MVFLEDQILQDPESKEMPKITLDPKVTNNPTHAHDIQGQGGDIEDYQDTVDDVADDAPDEDNEQDHDHRVRMSI